jgi:hypothetical protein
MTTTVGRRELARRANQDLEHATALEIMSWAHDRFGASLTLC